MVLLNDNKGVKPPMTKALSDKKEKAKSKQISGSCIILRRNNVKKTHTPKDIKKCMFSIWGKITEITIGDSEVGKPYVYLKIQKPNEHNTAVGIIGVIGFDTDLDIDKVNKTFGFGDIVAVGGVINFFAQNVQLKAKAIAKAYKLEKMYEYAISGDIIGDKSYL